MALQPGTHEIGPASGSLRVNTYREGLAQRVGHDLVLEVRQWAATVDVAADGMPAAITLNADSRSLEVIEGRHGVKPLTDRDRAEIRANIDEKILHGQPVSFRSGTVTLTGGRLHVDGDLTLAGSARPVSFDLDLRDDGHVGGILALTQSEWGIKPYRGFMGALKVRDTVEVVLAGTLPSS
jgi:hypothetical protein